MAVDLGKTISSIPGMLGDMNNKPTRTRTTATGNQGAENYGRFGLDQMQANINAGPDQYTGANPYNRDPNVNQQAAQTTMNNVGTNLGGLQQQYGAPGGRFDQAYGVNEDMSTISANQNAQVNRSAGPGTYGSGYEDMRMQNLKRDMGDSMKSAWQTGNTMFNKGSQGRHDREGLFTSGLQGEIANKYMTQAGQVHDDAYKMNMANMRQDSQDNFARNTANNNANYQYGNMNMQAADRMNNVNPQLGIINASSAYGNNQNNMGNYQQNQQIASDNWLQGNWQNNQNQEQTQLNDYMQGVAMNPWTGTETQTGKGKSTMDQLVGTGLAVGGMAASTKMYWACIPEGTKIDTKNGKIAIQDINVGDKVIGYSGKETEVLQAHQYKEDPVPTRFATVTFENSAKVDCCDMHRINGRHTKDYKVGDKVGSRTITNITWYNGVKRSYDLLTEDGGYMMSNIPVDSMIEELADMVQTLKAA